MLQSLVDKILYHPMKYPDGHWNLQYTAGALDCWLKTADNLDLHSWWFPKPDSPLVTLFLHGNAGNVTHRIDHAASINAAGSSILVPDYRGYGKSKGHPNEQGLYCDADAAYDELIGRGYAASHIIFHGESLGTAVAADLAARRPCAALILEAPFASLSAMAATVLPIIGPLFTRGFDTKAKITRVKVPVLIIHGNADEIIPHSQGQILFQAANEPKTFWSVPGAHHNDIPQIAGSQYPSRLKAFYQSLAR